MRLLLAGLTVACLVLAAACGGGDGDGDNPSLDDVIANVLDAVEEPGMVYHAEGDDQSMVWLDGERELFRRRESAEQGAATSTGAGWLRYSYDSNANEVTAEDISPQEGLTPRISKPIAHWFEPLNILSFGSQLRVIGQSSADGIFVIVVESTTPILNEGEETGRALVSRLEFAADTYMPHAFERRVVLPPSETPSANDGTERVRVVFTTSELIKRDTLGEGFFGEDVVAEQVRSLGKVVGDVIAFGLTPWWLGEEYATDLGFLGLPDLESFETDPLEAKASLRYALVLPVPGGDAVTRPDAVVVRLAPTLEELAQPTFPDFAGNLPERDEEVTVRGGPATLYTSLLTPNSLKCPTNDCPVHEGPLYRRLTFTIAETAVQVEVFPRLAADGTDLNGYNSAEAVLSLAEALTEATVPATEE